MRHNLTTKEVEKIKKEYKKIKSIRKVAKIFDISYTGVYNHIKNIEDRPKMKGTFNSTNLSYNEIGELMGAFSGDGSYYNSRHGRSSHHIIRFALNKEKDLEYAEYLIKLLKKSGLNPFLIKYRNKNLVEVKVNSIDFAKFIKENLTWDITTRKTYSIKLKGKIDKYNKNFLKGFLLGLLKTDGYKNSKRYLIGCTSKELIKNASDILTVFDIKHTEKIREDKRTNRKDIYFVSFLCKDLNR